MSVKIIISDILKKRHDKVAELEVVRRDIGSLGTTIEKLLQVATGGGRFQVNRLQLLHLSATN